MYCAISEARFGGIRNFHVEHFRPKGKFPMLENHIANLYLACGICNVLKGDDWPCEPAADHSLATYADPATTDYNTILSVSAATHEVIATTLSGRYIIERVLLNRAQLVLERRLAAMLAGFEQFERWVEGALDDMSEAELKAVSATLLKMSQTKTAMLKDRPYRDADTKRPVKAKAKKTR
ncbi:MAG TPA: HNH endonuclease [Vicinamibacterales bacterium]|nr:HNH endonuclease [Vicinamibacterales bacterium]